MSRTRVWTVLALLVSVVGCRVSEPAVLSTTQLHDDGPRPGQLSEPTWWERNAERDWVAKWSDGDNAYFQIDASGWFQAFVATRPNNQKPDFNRVTGQLPAALFGGGRHEFVKEGESWDNRCRINDEPPPLFRYVLRVRFDPKADDLWAEYETFGQKKQFQMRRVPVGE
ncbi:MAG TPA: hypothetical protein VD866_14105 [Urbifossiella sp.]|nr:hypothetical protein [Urbifossiella sp.]